MKASSKIFFTTNLLGVIVLFIVASSQALGQSSLFTENISCEENKSVLDAVASAIRSQGKNKFVIIVARLGDGERGEILNRIRLKSLTDYLDRVHNIVEEGHKIVRPTGQEIKNIVTAEGRRLSGKGRIEMYIDGKLAALIKFKRNEKFRVICPE